MITLFSRVSKNVIVILNLIRLIQFKFTFLPNFMYFLPILSFILDDFRQMAEYINSNKYQCMLTIIE